jgi:hypothetical protein
MASEIVMYLLALSLPVWFVAEQVNLWRRAVKSTQSGTVPGAPASSVATLITGG